MIEIDTPGFHALRIEHLVIDLKSITDSNGSPIRGVLDRLAELSSQLSIHVVTDHDEKTVAVEFKDLPFTFHVANEEDYAKAKRMYVLRIGADRTAAIGDSRSDEKMLTTASLAIGILRREGAAYSALAASDVLVADVFAALDLLSRTHELDKILRT